MQPTGQFHTAGTDKIASEKPPKANDVGNVPFFVARHWQGMTFMIWLRLLARHRFAIAPSRLPLALRITMFTIFNSGLGLWEKLLHNDGIKATELAAPPLFIVGHWRTGTTWLHELMALDARFTSPTTYQCMAPHHFIESQDIAPKLLPHLLQRQRPMDNMAVGWDRPQEDEFALCNLGAPSPYLAWAFPNCPNQYEKYLGLTNITAHEKQQWQNTLLQFLKHITYRDKRRIVLKSPTHTARIRTLLEVFPDAQFIHIVRDPYVVFPSTVRTWKRLWNMMGMQAPNYDGIEEHVFKTFVEMFRHFNEDKHLLGQNQLCEVRYEDLRANLMGEMNRIYDQLELGQFERVRPKLQSYADDTKDYKTNVFEQPQELRAKISERWREYIERYGYDRSS